MSSRQEGAPPAPQWYTSLTAFPILWEHGARRVGHRQLVHFPSNSSETRPPHLRNWENFLLTLHWEGRVLS